MEEILRNLLDTVPLPDILATLAGVCRAVGREERNWDYIGVSEVLSTLVAEMDFHKVGVRKAS